MFNDHLIIVDEAHNLRDEKEAAGDVSEIEDPTAVSDTEAGKQLTPILKQIVVTAEGLRLMLMTATPMYNKATEILFLLFLLEKSIVLNRMDHLRYGLRKYLSLVSNIGLGMNFTLTSSHFFNMRSLLVEAQANTAILTSLCPCNILFRDIIKRPSIKVGSSRSTKINLYASPSPVFFL
jgi:hypothetical protein